MIIIEKITYPSGSMAEAVFKMGRLRPESTAYEYLGSRRSYRELEGDIRACAGALSALGIARGDRIMLTMPNVPQAVIMFYAANLIGAVACMTHPLSSAEELREHIEGSKPRLLLTLYQFYGKLEHVIACSALEHVILTGPGDLLAPPLARLLSLREEKPPKSKRILRWNGFINLGTPVTDDNSGNAATGSNAATCRADEIAAVLYSGGTTGKTKGILLTNLNFNALAILTARAGDCIVPDTRMLAIMPVFHGFGLGICIHTALASGISCVLVPRFTVKSYAKLLKRQKPNYIAGVPTLFEALLRLKKTENIDLSMLRGVFSGGDTLPPDLRRRVDAFLKERGSPVGVREGYGLTECVTACCLTPENGFREGSIGQPFDDIFFKIVEPETQRELSCGETGEICISGPTVMPGYDGDDEETAQTLQTHSDGRLWLHTGDLGDIDSEGNVYFRGRRKRMIITSGYSVYPYHIERTLGAHEYVKLCAVIGVPDEYRMQRVKAVIVLREEAPDEETALEDIKRYCEETLAPFNRPREFAVRHELPTTLVGKVAYAKLEEQEGLA